MSKANNTQQYQEFLEELRELADFRSAYALDYPASRLDREDSDVKRIIEALAFFNSRTHLAALHSLDATHRRLYQQFFSYLLTPLAAMTMVQATPTGQLTEALELPKGTMFELQPEKGGIVMFSSTKALRILPIELHSVTQEPSLSGKGIKLLLSFQAGFALNEELETLSLYINYLNDFVQSLKTFHFLQQSLKTVSVQFGEYDSDESGTPCKFHLGTKPLTNEDDEWLHPLEKERNYFHFPQQELYLEIDLPAPPRNWKHFTIALDCHQMFPHPLRLHKDLFQLFTIPLVNNQRNMAEPIVCNGTQERYTIHHQQPELSFQLQKILGVYEATKQGMKAFSSGILSGGNGTYEVEQGLLQEGGGYLYHLIPHFPAAFEEPRTLIVDALWQQPWYDEYLKKNYVLRLFYRQVQGVKWKLPYTPTPHAENLQISNNTKYIHLLTLMHKPSFNFQNLHDLLMALGSIATSKFQIVFTNLVDLRMEEETLAGAEKRLTKQIYYLQFKPSLAENIALIECFTRHVGHIMDLWITDALVETRWEIQNKLNQPVLGDKK